MGRGTLGLGSPQGPSVKHDSGLGRAGAAQAQIPCPVCQAPPSASASQAGVGFPGWLGWGLGHLPAVSQSPTSLRPWVTPFLRSPTPWFPLCLLTRGLWLDLAAAHDLSYSRTMSVNPCPQLGPPELSSPSWASCLPSVSTPSHPPLPSVGPGLQALCFPPSPLSRSSPCPLPPPLSCLVLRSLPILLFPP